MRITEKYLNLQKKLHATGNYGKGVDVEECLIHIMSCIGYGDTILDYGCGNGHLGRACQKQGLLIEEYDPCIPGKDEDPGPADIVVCADVLEHIEPECIDAVLTHLQALTRKFLIAIIATRPAVKTLEDGRNAHVLLMTPMQWFDKLSEHFTPMIYENRHVLGRGVLFVGGVKE